MTIKKKKKGKELPTKPAKFTQQILAISNLEPGPKKTYI